MSDQLATNLVTVGQEELLLRMMGYALGAGNPPVPTAVPIEPFDFEARQSIQQALFICPLTLSVPLDEILDSVATNYDGFPVAWKLRLTQSMRPDALKDLVAMNVTPATLFPGLDGLGRASALMARFSPMEQEALRAALSMPSILRTRADEGGEA